MAQRNSPVVQAEFAIYAQQIASTESRRAAISLPNPSSTHSPMKTISLICFLALGLSSVRAADAVEAYSKNCASCHGKDGAGKTKAGKQVSVGDLTDAAHQKSFTDEEAFTSI